MNSLPLRLLSTLAASAVLAGCASTSSESSSSTSSNSTESTDAGEKSSRSERTARDAQRESPAPEATERASERATPASTRESQSEVAAANARLVEQLNDASRELATLRAANARLRADRSRDPSPPASTRADPADEKLAASFRSFAKFKEELTAFMAETERSRSDSGPLKAQLKEALNRTEEAKAALARAEGDLRREKSARAEAELAATKLREQMRTIARAMSAAGLSFDKASAEEPTARLEMNTSRVRGNTGSTSTDGPRRHVVKAGETLELLAEKYYNDRSKARVILEANRGYLRLDGKLEQGMEIDIPAK